MIKRVKRGDSDAFGKLYLKYLDAIYRYIYFRVNQEQTIVEDLTETVFFKAWENIKNFKENSGTFKAWLYMIAKNTVIDHYRKPQTAQLDENLIHEAGSIEEELMKDQEIKNLNKAFIFLTDEQREAVTLKYIEEMDNEDIGRILGKKEEAVRALQHRALEKLRKILK
ncbi:sigma-70 family RNA polymerase sigma factor [Candidatus Gottesmanbacteria bacterium]|nr:sigma-70 family RNA polymerase sigma factor [Candidatus Gottesmanbacteria bacterium]